MNSSQAQTEFLLISKFKQQQILFWFDPCLLILTDLTIHVVCDFSILVLLRSLVSYSKKGRNTHIVKKEFYSESKWNMGQKHWNRSKSLYEINSIDNSCRRSWYWFLKNMMHINVHFDWQALITAHSLLPWFTWL